ncbi:unnamed protein product [Tuber melanosporum]|uniref:(Perigord truffle) hypothetical protein n=1 Tax=Tuber melanosporum (strain Mel28) TaxID=656061 RepID=D5GL81_TUBMM|nr:uncharacterized protein GSTUM_00010053001 [Tuber melanosporum]CAZ85274.1 unnamed protein product [Tuber melanosporum]
MLGRLFSSANSAATSPNGTRPSTAAPESDDLHTRNLLYPDATCSSFHSSLSCSHTSSSSGGGFGENIDLDSDRDVRVIIAQDGTAAELKAVLYDSQPVPRNVGQPQPGFEDNGPLSPGLGGPHHRSRRRPMPPNHPFGASSYHPTQSASGVAPDHEMTVLTDCMFGSAPLAYKGPSTKVHILPTAEERKGRIRNSPVSSRRGSLRNLSSGPQQLETESHKDGRKEVLITRLFSVVMPPSPTFPNPPSGSKDHTSTPTSSPGSQHGFPFPKMANSAQPVSGPAAAAAKIVKPPKTYMYALGLIISLPPPAVYNRPSTTSSLSLSHKCCQLSTCTSFEHDHGHPDFLCSTPPPFDDGHFPQHSLNSLRSDAVVDDLQAPPSIDDRMDLITKHWDVINRALSDLQCVAQTQILNVLNTAGITSAQTVCQNGFKYRRRIELKQWALMSDDCVRGEVDRLRWRIVTGIKVPRVITGQGKWGVWRDEAHWANERFGGREMKFFFLTLLTAFLGHHTEWLDVLGPLPYRRKHQRQQQVAGNNEEFPIPTRTVILSSDKMASRRLIYLLSAFLPTKSFPQWDGLPPPSRTSSINYLSQSPPISGAMGNGMGGKKSSLRNRAKRKPSKLSMVTGDEEGVVVGWDIPAATSGESSTAPSVLQLPLANPARKAGSAGALTTAPSSVTAMPANAPGSPQKGDVRPSSSNSAASMNLMSTLKRTGTANTSMDSNSGWGSFLSFWSHSKTGSTAPSENSLQHDDGFDVIGRGGAISGDEREPVDVGELYLEDDDLQHHHHHKQHSAPPSLPAHHGFHNHHLQFSESQVRLSVDENDGVVDVDIPMPSLDFPTTGYTSPVSSPSSSGWAMSMPSLESMGNGFLGSGMSFSSGMVMPSWITDLEENAVNVAGWLDDEKFHPDFALQAVKPYPEVEEEIKRAMRAEATPRQPMGATPASESGGTSQESPNDRWIEVCSVLIADTRERMIKRLRLRRRSKKPVASPGTTSPLPSVLGAYRHLHIQQPSLVASGPYFGTAATAAAAQEGGEEEVIDEELVCDVDDVLATAVEKVIGISATPLPRPQTGGGGSRTTARDGGDELQKLNVQGCKCMVLGALENVVRAVAQEPGNVVENFLTEGVAKWLSDIQEAC